MLSADHQRRSAGNSRVWPIMSHQQRDFRSTRIHAPTRKQALDVGKERLKHGSNSTSHNNDVRIKQVDDVPNQNRQQLGSLFQNLASHDIAREVCFADKLAANVIELALGEIEKG